MSIKNELNKLKESDLWSFILFALFKVRNIPEYSGISELAYVLDKHNLLNLCEYFGGMTITIPKIEELEILLYGLVLYQRIHVDKIALDDAVKEIPDNNVDIREVKSAYYKILDVLKSYDITSRSKN